MRGWQKISQTESTKNPQEHHTHKTSQTEEETSKKEERFLPEEPKYSLDSLIVSEEVKRRIEGSLKRLENHKLIYEEWGLREIDPRGKRVVVNLYGPPGTGKSHCAEGIAKALRKKILRVNYAELESKYVGDTPKNITAVFAAATQYNAVLFFDEADSILGKRLTSVTQSADHGVNVSRSTMLLQLDRFDGIALFATNLAKNYDPAFVRRILTHIEFDLPDIASLERLWKSKLPSSLPLEEGISIDWLATYSQGLAGGDLVNIIIEAATRAAAREGEHRKVLKDDLQREIDIAKQAKEQIGGDFYPPPKIKETPVQLEELSPELKESVEARILIEKKEANPEKEEAL